MHCYPWNLCNESTIDKSLSKQQQYCRPTSKYIIALHHKHAVDPLGLSQLSGFQKTLLRLLPPLQLTRWTAVTEQTEQSTLATFAAVEVCTWPASPC